MPSWLSVWWYYSIFWFSYFVMTLGFSLRVEGRRRIPRTGPLLLLANHASFFDPVLVGLASPRKLSFLARNTLFVGRFFAPLIRSLDAFPIDQDGMSKEGLRTVLRLLEQQRAVLVFPEGTRTEDGRLQPLKAGVHLIAKKAHATIVPVGIAGAFHALPHWAKFPMPSPLFLPALKSALAVSVGRPLDSAYLATLSRDEAVAEITRALEQAIARAEQIQRKR